MVEDGPHFSLLVVGAVASVGMRVFFGGKQIERVTSTPMWGTDLPFEKRRALYVVVTNNRPTDINRFEEVSARYATYPTKIAAVVMYGVANAVHGNLGHGDRIRVLCALAAFTTGGIGINGTRHGHLGLDVFFRCVFGASFVAILHYLAEASDIVLIKSLG